jgi:DNA processing protein
MLARMETVRARAVLARTPALSCADLTTLLAAAGGEPQRALEGRVVRAAQLSPAARDFMSAPAESAIADDLSWLGRSGAQILLYTDPEYPPLLRQIAAPPAALYVLGSAAALSSPQLAMVGSRSPTPAGRTTAHEFAAWFVRAGLTVTSGLAVGIDAASHEGALAGGGQTVAVCGTGLDLVYPPEHHGLAQRIAAHGALVSEFPPGTGPARANFPRRNRIISGLSVGTLVVEAARHSGSLITARLAVESGREVFAIPGSIHSALSRGCHQLIKQGAKLVEEAADVLSELQISVPKEPLTAQSMAAPKPRVLDKEYEMLLDALGFEPATIDTLVARTQLPGESVASMLLILELEGRVASLPGGRYGRIP